MPGTLFVVATPIGNLEDITMRALRVLREVPLIAAEDTRRTAHLLAHYAIATPTTSLHEHNEASKTPLLLRRLEAGESVALVTDAGTPTFSDPGAFLVRAAISAKIRVEPIPGPNAVVAALSASGVTVTSFLYVGFPPKKSGDRRRWVRALSSVIRPIVVLEAPHRLSKTLADIRSELGDRQIVVARELTKVHEQFIRGPISTVEESLRDPKGELVIIIEPAEPCQTRSDRWPDEDVYAEFCAMTENEGLGRREAMARLADRQGRPVNEIYKLVERLKNMSSDRKIDRL